MIVNQQAATHAFHQPDRRVRLPKQVRAKSGVATGDCRAGMPLEEKCAWMRARQELKRRTNRRNPQ